jgi:ElaB/YqjD/DUF883 family membrane-anchored ribosome-binding protein
MTMPTNKFPDDTLATDVTGTIAQQVAGATSDARSTLSDMARAAGAKVESSRIAAADGLEGAAATVRDRADEVPGGPKVQELAHAAADRLSSTADYLRRSDAARMKSDVESLVKNNPGPALALAAVFGFLLGRALTRD